MRALLRRSRIKARVGGTRTRVLFRRSQNRQLMRGGRA